MRKSRSKKIKKKRKPPVRDNPIVLAKRVRKFCKTNANEDRLMAIISADKILKGKNDIVRRMALTFRTQLVTADTNPWDKRQKECMVLGASILEQKNITIGDLRWFQTLVIEAEVSKVLTA